MGDSELEARQQGVHNLKCNKEFKKWLQKYRVQLSKTWQKGMKLCITRINGEIDGSDAQPITSGQEG